jgi:para-nitrobenzyl esterase
MSSYWFLFILNGDPNTKGLPLWPRFDASGKMMMRFDVNSVAVPMADAPQLDLLYTKMYKN